MKYQADGNSKIGLISSNPMLRNNKSGCMCSIRKPFLQQILCRSISIYYIICICKTESIQFIGTTYDHG